MVRACATRHAWVFTTTYRNVHGAACARHHCMRLLAPPPVVVYMVACAPSSFQVCMHAWYARHAMHQACIIRHTDCHAPGMHHEEVLS
eukprot:353000-Chlamydomonas_euryale.AAC.20